MPDNQILVVAAPGQLQEGLQVILATLPDTTVVVVADTSAALAQVSRLEPQLVLIVARDGESTVRSLGQAYPPARFLVLVPDAGQVGATLAGGADRVLVEGVPAGRLLASVRQLLAEASNHSMEV